MSWWVEVIWRHFWWQELKEWVLNYLICQGCGCCSLAVFPNLELSRHKGGAGREIVVIVRGTIPCWICHVAKIHQSTRGDVILNVTFNWKINRKWHCPRLQFKHIIAAVSSAVCCRSCYSSNGNGWRTLPASRPPWVSAPVLPFQKRKQVKLPDLCARIETADDGHLKWYPGSCWCFSWAIYAVVIRESPQ